MSNLLPDAEHFSAPADFFQSLTPSSLVLTPNKRLARFLHALHDQWQAASGHRAWPQLPCLALEVWWQQLWDGLSAFDERAPMVVSVTEERVLWQQLIETSEDNWFHPAATAEACRRSWQTLVLWGQNPVKYEDLPEAYRRLAHGFQQRCERDGLLDSASKIQRVLQALDSGSTEIPRDLVLFAFDEPAPMVQRLVDAAAKLGAKVRRADLRKTDADVSRVESQDFIQELRAALAWAHEHLQQPGRRVGIVIPTLGQNRPIVERELDRALAPQEFQVDRARRAPGYNVSAGQSMLSTPPIADAIEALSLLRGEHEASRWGRCLTSPFLLTESSLPARSALGRMLSEDSLTWSATKIRARLASTDAGAEEDPLLEALQKIQNLSLGMSGSHPFGHWLAHFDACLSALGWPGERQLDSIEFQQIQAWRSQRGALLRMQSFLPSITREQALELIKSHLQTQIFQAKTLDSPLQVMGMLEAAGMTFDALWVTGLDEEQWPPRLRPDPFIPRRLQAELEMPLASQEKELRLARALTERFCQSADEVVLSYARQHEDAQRRPSALISAFPEALLAPSAMAVDQFQADAMASRAVEELADLTVRPIATDDTLSGGTQLIKDQSDCPFRAFAHHRLAARAADLASWGLSAADRGAVVHDALDRLWRGVGNQATLLAETVDQRAQRIDEAVKGAMRRLARRRSVGETTFTLECQRIAQQLEAWLDIERRRSPFTVIVAEQQDQLTLGRLHITIRYDRIDALEDGQLVLIDYKTGLAKGLPWFGLRPEEPQIPLYALAQQAPIAALGLAHINVDKISLQGLAAHEGIVEGATVIAIAAEKNKAIPDSWPALLESWQQTLNHLADTFTEGDAAIDPRDPPSTCQFCDIKMLCRIREARERQEVRP